MDGTTLYGLTVESNYLSQGNPGGELGSAKNLYQGLVLKRMSGWRSGATPGALTWRDFELAPSCAVIGAGDGAPLTMSQGDNTYGLDFNALPYNKAMDLGALHFSTVPIKTPKKPAHPRATP